MKIILSQGFGGLNISEDYEDIVKRKFKTANPYELRTNQEFIDFIISNGEKYIFVLDCKYMIDEIPKGTRYFIDDDEGYETILTPDDVDWEIAK